MLTAEQNDSQSEEINVIDESQAGNRPLPVQETESFFGRPFCLLCFAVKAFKYSVPTLLYF